jgi:hypothetical protein
MTDSIDFDEPGFPYLAFCPISIYDPANHNPEACPYCGPGNEMSDEDIEKIINGDWTPPVDYRVQAGQIASSERAHEGLKETIYVPKNDDLECSCIHGCVVKFDVIPFVITPKAFGECEHFRYVILLGDED